MEAVKLSDEWEMIISCDDDKSSVINLDECLKLPMSFGYGAIVVRVTNVGEELTIKGTLPKHVHIHIDKYVKKLNCKSMDTVGVIGNSFTLSGVGCWYLPKTTNTIIDVNYHTTKEIVVNRNQVINVLKINTKTKCVCLGSLNRFKLDLSNHRHLTTVKLGVDNMFSELKLPDTLTEVRSGLRNATVRPVALPESAELKVDYGCKNAGYFFKK